MKEKTITALLFLAAASAQAIPYSPEFLAEAGMEYCTSQIAGIDEASQTETTEGDELLPFGNLDQWYVRTIKESALMGGKTKTLYEIAPNGST